MFPTLATFNQSTPGRTFAAACICLFVVASTGQANAQRRDAAMAIDGNTGKVLYAKDADESRYPASLTKMMTMYIAFGEIEAGRLSYASRIKISESAAAVSPSKLDLEPGSEISLGNALKALVTKSANDIAVAVAEHISGSEPEFAQLMTKRARQIGMNATTFRNASGLPNSGQITTARDMLTLALRLHDEFPKHYRLFSLRSFTYNGKRYRNHNALLARFRGTEGIKTGYTRASGFNLVTSVKRDGKHVVAAVFGGATSSKRNARMRTVLAHALREASTQKTRKAAPLLVATAKPAKRRTAAVALKVAPRPAARPQRPPPAAVMNPASAQAAPMPENKLAGAPSQPAAASAASTAAIPPPFQIAMVKVRPATAPRGEDATASATGNFAGTMGAAPPPVAASLAPRLEFSALQSATARQAPAPAPTSPPSPTETIISKSKATGVRAPGTLGHQLAMLSRADAPSKLNAPDPAATAPSLDTTRTASPANPPPALPPSTLGAQAARLQARGSVSQATALYEIQIGTFGSADDAAAHLAAVQSKSVTVAGYPAVTHKIKIKGRPAYRARFAGFQAERATATCLELRRASIDCFVARPE